MFEHDQDTVDQLLTTDDRFRRLYDKHRDLNVKVDEVNSGSAAMEHFELETLKKEKLILRDRMQAIIHAHSLNH